MVLRSVDRSRRATVTIFAKVDDAEPKKVSKEDHDRERSRWLAKLDDFEKRLMDSETLNSEMVIVKAELNKKIVEMEKIQKPLFEQNRKLADRNKQAVADMKKLQKKLAHTQDDFISLKDAHERLSKENTLLKEKRTSPEKLEELDRYRSKVLEYSKCITALRSSGLEKDRRYELLVQKFKKMRKFMKKTDNEDDRASTVGSDCSATSSISLDTITEDFEEALEKDIHSDYQVLYQENAELQKALSDLRLHSLDLSEENLLREQLSFANTTISEQQLLLDTNKEMMSQAAQLKSTVISQQEKIRKLEQELDELNQRLVSQQDTNDLLEFQVLEMEASRSEEPIQNDVQLLAENKSLKERVAQLLEKTSDVENLKKRAEDLEKMKNTMSEEMRTLSKELGKVRFHLQGKETDLTKEKKLTEVLNKQLQQVVSTNQEDSNKKEEELKKIKGILNEKDEAIQKLTSGKTQIESEYALLKTEYEKFKAEQRPGIRTELERRYEETKYKLNEALEKIHDYELLLEASKNIASGNVGDGKELNELKEYNAHLERQFQSQTGIIELLKKKVIQQKSFTDLLHKLSDVDDIQKVQDSIIEVANDTEREDSKLAEIISYFLKEARKKPYFAPLEISTTHRKIRPYSSVDSSGECLSNSSEGMVSPDEGEDWRPTSSNVSA